MKDFVMLVSLACIFVGIPMFFIGRFIEKGQQLRAVFKGEESESKLGDRLFWLGAGIFALGLFLMLYVLPKL